MIELPRWDFKLPKSSLSDRDIIVSAYAISSYLHNCTGIPHCRTGKDRANLCVMCGSATKLVLQEIEPKLKRTLLDKIGRVLGFNYLSTEIRYSDDA